MTEFASFDLEARGARLEVLEAGDPSKPPVVFIHGLRDVAWSLTHIAAPFAGRHHILLPGLRGHGNSDHPGTYGMENFIHDLYVLVDQRCAQPPIIVGHSLGGQIGVRFAALFPEMVQGFVCIEGLGPPTRPDEEGPQQFIEGYRARLMQHFSTAPASRGMTDVSEAQARLRRNNPRISDEIAHRVARHATRQDEDGRLRWNFDHHAQVVFMRTDRLESERFWRAVTCPTLIISGDLSYEYWGPMIDQPGYTGHYGQGEMDARAAMFANAHHVPFDRSGHMVHYDEPQRLITAIENFIKELPS